MSQGALADDRHDKLLNRMTEANSIHIAQSASAALSAEARGKVKAIDAKQGTVTIAHDPVPSLQWPAMTMEFAASQDQLKRLSVGNVAEFEFISHGLSAKILTIQTVQKLHRHKQR
ncbi:Cation efflux system protein CusF precursor [compost metagenome]